MSFAAIQEPPEGEGKKRIEEEKIALRYIDGICSSCHDAELITMTDATKEEWLEIVTRMNGKGSGLSEQDVELLVNYLARKYPKKE